MQMSWTQSNDTLRFIAYFQLTPKFVHSGGVLLRPFDITRTAQNVLRDMAMECQQLTGVRELMMWARRLGRQMPGQHVLVPYNGTIYAAQLSFDAFNVFSLFMLYSIYTCNTFIYYETLPSSL